MASKALSSWSGLLDVDHYETDACGMHGMLPRNKHVVGKGGAVNWREGLHSMLRGRLNGLARRAKRRAKSIEMPVNPLALVFCHKSNSMPLNIGNTRRIIC